MVINTWLTLHQFSSNRNWGKNPINKQVQIFTIDFLTNTAQLQIMAGYSGTPLLKKLGIKPDMGIKIYQAPEEYWNWLGKLPDGISASSKGPFHFVYLFVKTREIFERELLNHKEKILSNGMIWVSWPKKSSGIKSDLDENIIRDFALKNKLVDVKVCAVSEIWSGLKLVIPVSLRKK
jgi:hypothetical protein